MPYSADVYTLPPGTTATTLTPIDSSDYNAFIADIEAAQNDPRPIVAGGTGGTSRITGWDGLSAKGTDVPSASTLNLTTATGPRIDITGTTTVTAVTLAAGSQRLARATGAFQITAGASLLVNGSASLNYTTVSGDLLLFEADSTVVSVYVLSSIVGTWTPTLAATGATFSYADRYGRYVRRGPQVTVEFRIQLNTSGNTLTANALTITGLPFTSAGDTTFSIMWQSSTSSYVGMWGRCATTSTITIYGLTAAATSSTTAITASAALHATNGSLLWGSFSYFVQ